MFLRCFLILCLAGGALPLWADNSQICDHSARSAARAALVPSNMMVALTYLGTDGHRSPWTVHVDGAVKIFATRAMAETFVHTAALRGQTRFLVGCFQVLHIWQGRAEPVFDPDANARRAAWQLAAFRAHTDNWGTALTRYYARQSDVATIATVSVPMPDPMRIAGLLHERPVR